MTEQAKQRANRRKEKERQKTQEQALMRQRLVKIIETPTVSDSEALKAIQILHDMDEHRY